MFKRFRNKATTATAAALLAALGVGGVALAQSSSSGPASNQSGSPTVQLRQSSIAGAEAPGQESTAPENSAADPDNVQGGDQSNDEANDSAGSDANDAPDKGEVSDKADAEQDPASERESGSDVPGDDGPAGHADEPGTQNANHEAEGHE